MLVGQFTVDVLLQQLQVAEHDVDGRLQLMRGDGNELRLETIELLELSSHGSKTLRQSAELVRAIATDGERAPEMSLGDGPHAGIELLERRADRPGEPDADAERDQQGNSERTEREDRGVFGAGRKIVHLLRRSLFHRVHGDVEDAVDGVQRRGNDQVDDRVTPGDSIGSRELEGPWYLLEEQGHRRPALPDRGRLRQLRQRIRLSRELLESLEILPLRRIAGERREVDGLSEQLVVRVAHAAEQECGGVLPVPEERGVVLEFLQGAKRQHQRRDHDDRDAEDAEVES